MVVYLWRGREVRGKILRSRSSIMKVKILKLVKRIAQLGLILVCMTCLTSCGVVTGVVGFLVSIPIRVVDAICP